MITKRDIQDWNKRKWEHKNHAMYEKYAQNKWPWFNDKLDPDIEEYLRRQRVERPGHTRSRYLQRLAGH